MISFQTLVNHLHRSLNGLSVSKASGWSALSTHPRRCKGPKVPVAFWKSTYNWKWLIHWTGPRSADWRTDQNQDWIRRTWDSPYHLMAAWGTHSRLGRGVQGGRAGAGVVSGGSSPGSASAFWASCSWAGLHGKAHGLVLPLCYGLPRAGQTQVLWLC